MNKFMKSLKIENIQIFKYMYNSYKINGNIKLST